MNLEKMKFLENLSKTTSFENYFDVFPNFSFTSIQLKQKRVLAFLLKRLIMIPKFHKLAFEILSYFLKNFEKNEKVEQNISECCERIFFGKNTAFTNLKAFYMSFFKLNKKHYPRRFYFMLKLISLLIKHSQEDEAKTLIEKYNCSFIFIK